MYSAIAHNKRMTIVTIALFCGVTVGTAYVVCLLYGATSFFPFALVAILLYALFQYFAASRLSLGMTGAKEVSKATQPRLYRIVENLAITEGLPMPKVYVIQDAAPNAFATGRDPAHAHVGATTGLLEIMSDRELSAVMAHEIGHVKNYDIRVSMIAFGLASVIAVIADFALNMMFFALDGDNDVPPVVAVVGVIAIILAPFVAAMIQSAISRQREYLADATGAMTTRDNEGMASALEKLLHYSQPMRRQSASTSHLFLNTPLRPGMLQRLFSTHPPLQDRIQKLRNNAATF